MSVPVRFRLLGPLEVAVGSHLVVLTGPQQRAFLATLLVNAGRVVSSRDLMAELWPDGSRRNVRPNTLHAQVARLRSTFIVGDRPVLEVYARPGGYVVEVPAESIDVGQFETLRRRAVTAAGTDPLRAITLLRQALGLWRGDALQDSALGRRCQAVASRLDEDRLQTLEQLARLQVAHGQPDLAVAALRELAYLHPMRETALAGLMAALHACGRRAEALQVFQQARGRFTDEFGAEPGQVMQQQHLRILQEAR